MSSLWCQIEGAPDAAAALNWRRWFGTSFDAAAVLCLDRTERMAKAVACLDGCGCGHRVKPRGTKYVAICECGEDCDDFTVTAEDVHVWKFDLPRLGRAIVKSLACDALGVDLSVPRTRQIASIGNPPLPVILTVQPDEKHFRSTVAHLTASLPSGFVLIAPTKNQCSAIATELMSKVKAGFFDLESQFTLLGTGALNARRSAAEMFAPFMQKQSAPLTDGEAERVFALRKKFRPGKRKVKGSLGDVFDLLVIDKASQALAARECKCSEGTISSRVREIEKLCGLKLPQLQAMSSRLGELQGTDKDSRAAKLYRKGLTDDTGETDDE